MTYNMKFSPSNKTLKGLTPVDDFNVTYSYTSTSIPGTTTQTTEKDVLVDVKTFDSALFTYTFSVVANNQAYPTTLSLVSGPATLNGNVLTATGQGTAKVSVSGYYGTREYDVPTGSGGSYVQKTPRGYTSNSLIKHVNDNLVGYYTGKSVSDASTKRWSSATWGSTAATTSVTRNPSRVAPNLDLSWLAIVRIVNNVPNEIFPCALISPRHIIVADHVGLPERAIFERTDGTLVEANVLSGRTVVPADQIAADCKIGYLDRDVDGCTFARFMPPLGTYAPGLVSGTVSNYGLPVMSVRSNGSNIGQPLTGGAKLLPLDIKQIGTKNKFTWMPYPFQPEVLHDGPKDPVLSPFYYPVYNNDSSSMLFCPVTVGGVTYCGLVTTLHTVISGADFPALVPKIQEEMNYLSTLNGDNRTFSPLIVDCSAFATY